MYEEIQRRKKEIEGPKNELENRIIREWERAAEKAELRETLQREGRRLGRPDYANSYFAQENDPLRKNDPGYPF